MNTALWIVQALLAIAFLMAGAMKTFQPKEKLAEKMGWVEDFSQGQIRTIGILEILGALGLILPALAVPLDVTSDFEIATLASTVTLTPGTLSVDIGRDTQSGQRVLFVHTLFTADPDKLRGRIKDGFERYILEISQGGSPKEQRVDGE